MSGLFDNIKDNKFDIKCPECGRKVTFKGRDINHDVTCPGCHSSIHLDGKDFEKQLKNFDKQLNNLFK